MKDESKSSRTETGVPNYWAGFSEASEASSEDLETLKALARALPELPPDPIEACYAIRAHLINNGFTYNDKIFTLGDLSRNKSGNCLGLCLLFGAILEERGYKPSFEIVLTPKDAVYSRELKLLDQLTSGGYFSYDKPAAIPAKQARHPQLRFAPLEHPAIIVFGEKRFETTSLDDESDPEVSYDAELFRSVNYNGVLSGVYIDRAKVLLDKDEQEYAEIKKLIETGLELWPENREAWALLWEVSKAAGDAVTSIEAQNKYIAIGGDDSRYYHTLYRITGEQRYLDLSLARYPANMEAWAEKNVRLLAAGTLTPEQKRELKFNLAVAGYCFANSSVLTPDKFKAHHKEALTLTK